MKVLYTILALLLMICMIHRMMNTFQSIRMNIPNNSVTFCLDQKFSKLSFRLGQWEMEKDNHGIVSIYKGKSAKESSLLLRVRRKPAERDKSYSVDVSDCNFITIQTKSNDFGAAAPLVTNGFKVTYK